jgi:hypothetical protein
MPFPKDFGDDTSFNLHSFRKIIDDVSRPYLFMVEMPNIETDARKLTDIIITNEKGTGITTGVMLENFNISVSQEWESLFNIRDKFAGAQKVLSGVADIGLFNSGAWTQKIFRGGGYLEISPKFRVYDKDSTGVCIEAVKNIMVHILPKYRGNFRTIDDLASAARSVVEKIGKNIESGAKALYKDTANTLTKVGKKIGTEIVETATGQNNAFFESAAAGVSDLEVIKQMSSSSPSPITIQIGELFRQSEMLVTNLNVDFSKEFCKAGPLYVDITLNLSSLVAAEASMVNNGFSNNLTRFEIVN